MAVTLAAVTQNLQHSSQVNSSPAVALLCFAVLVIGASLCQPEKTPRRFAWQRACRTVAAERMVQCEFFQLTMGANISSLYTRPLLAHVRSCSLKRLVNISSYVLLFISIDLNLGIVFLAKNSALHWAEYIFDTSWCFPAFPGISWHLSTFFASYFRHLFSTHFQACKSTTTILKFTS